MNKSAALERRLVHLCRPFCRQPASVWMTAAAVGRARARTMMRLPTHLVLAALFGLFTQTHIVQTHEFGLCRLSFCECIPDKHPSWTTVNCTVPPDQKLDILEGDLPDTTTDLIVSGAEAVLFDINALSRLTDIRHIYVSGVKLILMKKFAAVNLNVISVYLEINKCDVLRIEDRTFSNIKGPLSVSIDNCDYASLDSEAFSWLLTMNISNVRKLDLGEGAFMLDPTAANVGEHGPGMKIGLKNLTVSQFPAQTFGSSAASISFESVDIRAIRPFAFTANTYNIVMAVNCSFHLIEGEAFAQKSLINNLYFYGCKVHQFSSNALQSAVANLSFSHSRFENVEPGAINATAVSVVILDSVFKKFSERGFEISSWNKLQMERNSFDELAPHAVMISGTSVHELTFIENEIEKLNPDSLDFIGHTWSKYPNSVTYKNNYYGQPCHCNITPWLAEALATDSSSFYENESYCTVEEFFARCFNVPDQNMQLKKFLDGVCGDDSKIQCETFQSKIKGEATEIKNPRFPHKKEEDSLSDRNKKVIGIIVVSVAVCVIIALFFSLVRCMKRRGYCISIKNFLITNTSCASLCNRLFVCGTNEGMDNAGSISQLSIHEYSERHRLNEPRVQETTILDNQHTTTVDIPLDDLSAENTAGGYVSVENAQDTVPTDNKTTQTLPEELTKELLEHLKQKLDDPDKYVEAREMIEHLYELIKVEEHCNTNSPVSMITENIYELPFQNTAPRIGKNKRQMISVGTRTPSLDKLSPLSPYSGRTALAHEYFEPKDLAVHLYAEIANSEMERKKFLGIIPDVVSEQAPRGPYLRAMRDKWSSSSSGPSPARSLTSSNSIGSPQNMWSIKSSGSSGSNLSANMMNRPLPQKPVLEDPGEGPSVSR